MTYKQTCMRPVEGNGEVIASGVFGNKDQFSWTLTSTGVLTVSGKGNMPKFNVNTTPWYQYLDSIVEIEVGEGITEIGRCAFYGLKFVTKVTLPKGITSINDYAFNGCFSLKTIEIPDTVVFIADTAFTKTGVTL